MSASPIPPGPFLPAERRATAALAAVFAMRMLGLFMVLPVMAVAGQSLAGATPLLIGLAIGAYGLMQGLLQIPYGLLSDRYGRKPLIVAGLVLFAAGGLISALSEDIVGVIAGRAMQGCGAVSGVVMALLADTTRDSHRARAMAVVGVTIGLSFGVAMVVGPLVASTWGLSGLFGLTTAMALVSLVLVLVVVPAPVVPVRRSRRRLLPRLARVLAHPGLWRLDLGVFLLHALMVVVFLVVPPALTRDLGLPLATHWQVYLPVILGAILLMGPLLVRAERAGRLREMILAAAATLVAALVVLALSAGRPALLVGGLVLFFVAFNLLEAGMPALVSRTGPVWSRGTAMGVYASSQFTGAFAGGLAGGALVGVLPAAAVLAGCALVFALWAVHARTLRNGRGARAAAAPGDVSRQGA